MVWYSSSFNQHHQVHQKLLQIPEGAKVLPAEHPRSQAVQRVINTLAERVSSLEGVPEHLKNIEWNVIVVESKVVNAMAAPGGHVVVFTGMVLILVLEVAQ